MSVLTSRFANVRSQIKNKTIFTHWSVRGSDTQLHVGKKNNFIMSALRVIKR